MIIPEAGSFYVMDRGYLDFERLFSLNNAGAFFVICSKNNILLNADTLVMLKNQVEFSVTKLSD